MALTNYTTLQAALVSALHRSDLANNVADFITLAEDKLNKRLRIRGMEQRSTAPIIATTEYLALPDRFLAMKNFQLNTSPVTRLDYASPEYIDAKYGGNSGRPQFYTFIGGAVQIAPVSDGVYTAEMDFYKKLDIAADATNWVLTNAPRCYYYGALMEAAAFMVNDKRIAVWAQLLERAIEEVDSANDSDNYPDFGLQIRSDVGVPNP